MFLIRLYSLLQNTLLTKGTGLPTLFGAFITANMEIGARKKGNHLINDIFQECKNTLLTRTHYDILHSPNIPRGNGVSLTGQPGIGGYSRKFMSRNF